jgi:subtilisin family serine protease
MAIPTEGAGSGRLLRDEVERARQAAARRRKRAFRLDIAPGDWDGDGLVDYLYRSGEIIVDDPDIPRVADALRDEGIGWEVADPLFSGVTLLALTRTRKTVPEVLDLLDQVLGTGVATPNHVIDIQGWSRMCPATEPLPAPEGTRQPWPPVASTRAEDIRVAVVDTGFLDGWQERDDLQWLHGVNLYEIDDEAYYAPRLIAPYGGHGTFVAGTVRAVAPDCELTVNDVLTGGVVDEAGIVRELILALERSPDIITMSAGTYTRKNVPPKTFVAFWEHRLRHHKGVALLTAAGNDGSRKPFWPAAFPWVFGVGSLTQDGERRSAFSNHGGWVDVYAPGEDHVNAFCVGSYTDLKGNAHVFDRPLAVWSGTSFSTPLVAGLVARQMTKTGRDGQEAVEALREEALAQFRPGVGPRLLP